MGEEGWKDGSAAGREHWPLPRGPGLKQNIEIVPTFSVPRNPMTPLKSPMAPDMYMVHIHTVKAFIHTKEKIKEFFKGREVQDVF